MALETRLVEHPILLIAPPKPRYDSEDCSNFAMQRFIRRYDLLRATGLDVRVLGATRDSTEMYRFSLVEKIEALRPGSIVRIRADDPTGVKAICWPRDIFQVYLDHVFVNPGYEDKVREIFSQLTEERISVINSYWGQGGFVVRNRNVLVASKAVVGPLKQYAEDVRILESAGYTVFYLPVPKKEDSPSPLISRMMLNQHIDTEFNLIHSPKGNILACVNIDYYNMFQEQVDELRELLDAKLHIIPAGIEILKKAVNFKSLPNGMIMLPSGCPSTQSFFEANLGCERVLVAEINSLRDYSGTGGGLRCMSNLIE